SRLMKNVLASILLFVPLAAWASPSDPTKSTIDPILVGNSSGADMGNAFHVVCRDVGNIPQAGQTVTVRFLGTSARPYTHQNTGRTTNCTAETIAGISNGKGQVVFLGRLGGFEDQGIDEVRSNGVLLGHVLVRSTDLDGNGATDLADINAFRERFVGNAAAP